MSDGQAVFATLTRARRRLMAATFVRWASCAMAVGVAGLVVTTLLAGLPFAPGRPLAIIAAIAVALAVAIAAWRRPTLAQTAAALDTRLGLADLAIAAHALRDSPHPMAQLVVRDARQRLASASLVRVLPMPRRLATWSSGGSIAALLLGVLAGGGSAPAGNLVPAGGTGRIVSGGPAAQRGGAAAATPATAPGGRTVARPSEPEAGPSPNRSLPPETPSARALVARPAAGSRGQQPGAGGSNGAAEARGRTAGPSGNAGRGAADGLAVPGSAAGGVQQGTVTGSGPAQPLPGVDAPLTTGDIRQATQRAEAALARDEIPPRMKPLVRRYFQSMRSESR